MSLPQLRRTLADLRWTIVWYALGLAGYGLLIVAFWPPVRQNAATYAQFVSAFPEALRKAFGIEDITHFTGFIGAEYLNLMWPMIAAVFVIMTASAFVAGEVDRGTVELWLSVPERRWRLLAAKEAALLVGIAVLSAATVAAIGVAAAVAGEALSAGGLAATGVVLASFCVAVAGYTSLFSSALSSRGAAAGAAAALSLASYLAGVLSGLSKNIDVLKYVSLQTAFHPQRALAGSAYASEAAILVAIGWACAVASLVVFERRDAAP